MFRRNRIRIICAMVLGIVTVGIVNHLAEARDRKSLQYLGEAGGDEIPLDDTQHRALAYSASERPQWLNRVLAKLQAPRGPGAELTQMVLFRQNGKPTYLVLGWRNDNSSDDPDNVVEIYRVRVVSQRKVLLHKLWQAGEFSVRIVEPTGHDVFGDGLPAVFIEVGSGGSDYSGYELLVLRLGRTVRSLTPTEYRVRPIIAADLLDDGRHALVASDDRWAQYFYGCGQCGPLVPTVFAWRDGRYKPACRDFRRYFQERIALFESAKRTPAEGDAREISWRNVEYETNIVLNLVQMGQVDAGLARYRAMVERVRRDETNGTAQLYFDPETVKDVVRDFGPAIDGAVRNRDAACPLSATPSEGAHPGWIERVQRFR